MGNTCFVPSIGLFVVNGVGAISLTTIGLLAAHLTEENHVALLEAARHKSKREVERLVAALHPQPDIPSSVRALPAVRGSAIPARPLAASDAAHPPGDSSFASTPVSDAASVQKIAARGGGTGSEAERRPALIAPLAPGRYLIRITVSEGTHRKLQRARDLLRHVVPDGDPADIVDRALTVLLQQAEGRKLGAGERPRASNPEGIEATRGEARHVPAFVRRTVWARDQGRCAFVGAEVRCGETGGLEYHHVVPFASGGPTTVENLQLRCRAHNAFEGRELFGDWRRGDRGSRSRNVDSGRTELTPATG